MTGIAQAMIYLARYSRFGLGVRWFHEAWSSCIPCVPQYMRPHLRLGRGGCKDLDGPYIFIKFLALQIILTPWSMVRKFNNFRFKKYSVVPIIQPIMQIQGLVTVGWICEYVWSTSIGNPDLDAQVEIGGLKKLADPDSSNSVIVSEAVPAICAIDLYPELYLHTPILWSISVQ